MDRSVPSHSGAPHYIKTSPTERLTSIAVDPAVVTTIGTVGILMDAAHIFEFVDQDRIIDIYRGK